MTRDEEVLTILQEECAEVIQAVSKIRRFGSGGNMLELKKEIADLQCMIDLAIELGTVMYVPGEMAGYLEHKRAKLAQFSSIVP